MVRRALLDRARPLTGDDDQLSVSQPPAPRADRARPRWRGAGGRWLVWVARAVAWAVLLLIGYRGVLAIAEGPAPASPSAAAPAAAIARFPVSLAEAYALQFGDAYLNFSPATAVQRGQELARFVPGGMPTQLGWNGAGSEHVVSEQVSALSVTGAHTAVVTVLAQLGSGRLVELAVPVYAARGGLSVPGDPALLPGPAKALPPASQPAADQAAETALQDQLPAFFQAYASGNRTTLARFAAPGAHLTGLDGAVTFGGLASVYAPPGGKSRDITVTVIWHLPAGPARSAAVAHVPAAVPMTYSMRVIRDGASWDVKSIGAAVAPPGQGPP
jgi:hypothetical protein